VDTLAGLAEELARPMAEPTAPRGAPAAPPPRPVAGPPPPVATTNVPLPGPGPGVDQSLAEMAQRLEAALRRPTAQKVVAEGQRVTATVEIKAARDPNAPPASSASPAPSKPAAPAKSSNLEREMANLLNKPGKT
jgi:hypothetical protein